MITEKQVQDQILCFLQKCQIFAWTNKTTGVYDTQKGVFRKSKSRFDIKGVSDVLGVLPDGKFLAIEVKRPSISGVQKGGMLSKEQKLFLENVKNNGGLAFVARDLNDVTHYLKDYLKAT